MDRRCLVCAKDISHLRKGSTMCSKTCRNHKANRVARGWPIAHADQKKAAA